MSSIQSVPGQPESAPDSRATHQTFSALPLSAPMTASQVVGASPVKLAVLYQMRPFRALLMKTPMVFPSLAVPSSTNAGAVSAL